MERSDYLYFGGSANAAAINQDETLAYLESLGYGNGDLRQARDALSSNIASAFSFAPFGVRYCDFCFLQLMGGEYQELKDGRERCSRCSRSVITSQEQFTREFTTVRRNMEVAFGISLAVPITVRMVNATEIARNTNEKFSPTPGADPRVLGFATMEKGRYLLYVENGSPRMPAVATMAHELTHIWQLKNWDESQIIAKYGPGSRLPVYEGMAMWAMIQYLLFIREFSHAERQYAYAIDREDEYGEGFRIFLSHYALHEDGDVGSESPFAKPMPL